MLRIPILSSVVKRSFRQQKRQESVSLFGLQFNNRVGLAAGFDKDGKWLDILQFMGFGFIEVGTVTPLPQSGNNKPRLFRLKKMRQLSIGWALTMKVLMHWCLD